MWSLRESRVCEETFLSRGLVIVVLRLPSLFIADAWSRRDPEVLLAFTKNSRLVDESHVHHMVVLAEMLYYLILGLSLAMVLLPLRHLVRLYIVAASAALVLIANFVSARFVQEEETSPISTTNSVSETVQHVVPYLLLQYGIASAVAHLLGIQQHFGARLVLLVYSLPLLTRLLGMPATELPRVHYASSTFMLLLSALYLLNKLLTAVEVVRNGISCALASIQVYGLFQFVMTTWLQMCLPLQFLIFWIVLFVAQLCLYCQSGVHPIWDEGWSVVLLACLSENCSSPLSFLGACVTTAYLSEAATRAAILYLGHNVGDAGQSSLSPGFTEGIIMFCLGIQTGLVELKSADRIILVTIILFVVLSSLIQSLFELADPVLLCLAVSQNKNISKHVRAVLLSTFLWVFPIAMTARICRLFDIDLWLLVVLSSYVLTSLQALGALFIYMLVIFDSIRSLPSENLDDFIYYTKCLTRVLEFFVAVFVVGYGVERSVVGTWNLLNSSILALHCYCNVWLRLQAGWSSYLQRRDAIKLVNVMREASQDELCERDDLCAICYQCMVSARVTPCRHLFHGVCLKKWLYIQDYCPICHQKIVDVGSKGVRSEQSR